jgi:O-acetyl-ADP-ribose deacetylase
MRLAGGHELESMAFPAISTGIYGYPLLAATEVAVAAIREALGEESTVRRVVFACFGPDALDAYRHAI